MKYSNKKIIILLLIKIIKIQTDPEHPASHLRYGHQMDSEVHTRRRQCIPLHRTSDYNNALSHQQELHHDSWQGQTTYLPLQYQFLMNTVGNGRNMCIDPQMNA